MKGGVVVDDWKLEIFRRRLTDAGYTFTEHPGLTPTVSVLSVEFTDQQDLAKVIMAAQLEAAERKQQ